MKFRTSCQRRRQTGGHCSLSAALLLNISHLNTPSSHTLPEFSEETVVGITLPLENLLGVCYIKVNATLKEKERKSPGEKKETKQAHAATEQCLFLFYFG